MTDGAADANDAAPPRTGIWLFPSATVHELVDGIVAADAAGIDEAWIADEGVMREPVVALSAAAVLTTRIKLGIGITTPVLRHPGALASSIATLDELSNGRAILGLGVGGRLTLDPFRLVADKPVGRIRDAIRIARAVIERRATDCYEPPEHAMPPRHVPIFVASRGEQINRLASREADGAFLSGVPLDDLARQIDLVRSARPIHVALYPSARFTAAQQNRSTQPVSDGGAADPSALSGDPSEIARGLRELITAYRPESIGLCLVEGRPIAEMVAMAIESLTFVREMRANDL